VLGNKTVLFMANHGVTTVGQSVADAYNRLYYLERAAQVQIYAMWTGQRLKQLPEAVIEKTKNEIGGARFYYGPTPAGTFALSNAFSIVRKPITLPRLVLAGRAYSHLPSLLPTTFEPKGSSEASLDLPIGLSHRLGAMETWCHV